MRFVALVSGGKDSIYSIFQCIQHGHELVAVVHLGAPKSTDEESYMYQTAASEVVKTLVEECMQVPLILYQRRGKSLNTSLVYENENKNDEVEDLYAALAEAQTQFEFTAVASGALFSTYQRVRIESVCRRLHLTSLSYLWRLLPQKEVLKQMIDDGIEAVLVRTASPPGLLPRKHLNKTLSFLWHTGILERLHQRYQFHVCGEGGEYESLVIDSPLHKRKLVLDSFTIEETDDGVGILKILECHAEDKATDDVPILRIDEGSNDRTNNNDEDLIDDGHCDLVGCASNKNFDFEFLPHICESTGGLIHVTEIMAACAATCTDESTTEAELAAQEAIQIFSILQKTLHSCGATVQDVMFVHLFLYKMSHFATINAHYEACFGSVLPPSRSCVAVGSLPGGRRVLLDCMVQKGSGAYMRSSDSSSLAVAARATFTSKLRQVLHVQSISEWAPVCIGPYSQCNTLRTSLHFMAGQIGLIPSTMQLHTTWNQQLRQCWTNVASVLDALDGASLKQLFSGLVYVVPEIHKSAGAFHEIQEVTCKSLIENGKVEAGRIDAANDSPYAGYEDEGTMKELQGSGEDTESDWKIPMLILAIPEMPMNAAIEVEVICVTTEAASCLELSGCQRTEMYVNKAKRIKIKPSWDTGHGCPESIIEKGEETRIDAYARVIGHGCSASVFVTASTRGSAARLQLKPTELIARMLDVVNKVLSDARSGITSRNAIHVRLYHLSKDSKDDGIHWRTSLQSAISVWDKRGINVPASTVVPVHGIGLINMTGMTSEFSTFLAMQVLAIDPVHLGTEQLVYTVNRDELL